MQICPRTRSPGAAGIRIMAPKRWPNSKDWIGGRSAATNSGLVGAGFIAFVGVARAVLSNFAGTRAIQQQLTLAGVLRERSRALEIRACLLEAAHLSQQFAARAHRSPAFAKGRPSVAVLGENDHLTRHAQIVMKSADVREDPRICKRHSEAGNSQRRLRESDPVLR
jgi:hypothetical protein